MTTEMIRLSVIACLLGLAPTVADGEPLAGLEERELLERGEHEQALTAARLRVQLGQPERAFEVFRELAAAAGDPALRAEALARAGVVARSLERHQESIELFEQLDRETGDVARRWLVEAVVGVRPPAGGLPDAWRGARLGVDRSDVGAPRARVRWPDAGCAFDGGEPFSISVKDGEALQLVRMLATVSGATLEADPCLRGRVITLEAADVPVSELLETVLATLGLECTETDDRVLVSCGDRHESFTWAALKTVDLAARAHVIDHGRPPAAEGVVTTSEIAAAVEPFYVAALPRVDAWGRPLRYWTDGEAYCVGSAGADGALDLVDLDPRSAMAESDDIARCHGSE